MLQTMAALTRTAQLLLQVRITLHFRLDELLNPVQVQIYWSRLSMTRLALLLFY